MFAVDVKLVLLMLALPAALVEAQGPCCYSKELDGKKFTLIESKSNEVTAYGCDTANSCIYGEDGTNDRFCFKRGGVSLPTCLQQLPTCAKYFVSVILDGSDPDGKHQKIETFGYNSNETSNTCDFPSIPSPRDKDFNKGKFIPFGDGFMIFDYTSKFVAGKAGFLELDGGTWQTREFNQPNGDLLPDTGAELVPWKKELYLVGGEDGGPRKTIYKSVDGMNWVKLGWGLKHGRDKPFACITTNDHSGHASLLVYGGSGTVNNDDVIIYDLEVSDPSAAPATIELPAGFKPDKNNEKNQLKCHAGWMHILDFKNNKLHSLQLAQSYDGNSFGENNIYIDGAQLIVYNDKVGLVGGLDTGNKHTKFTFFDPVAKDLKDGGEFLWNDKISTNGVLVPVISE